VTPASAGATRSATALTRAGALLAGGVVAAVVIGARTAGLLDGVAGVICLGVALIAIPTSRNAARRVLLAGALVLGGAPVMWLVDLPVAGFGRVSVALAGLMGGLVAWALWRGVAAVPARARTLIPRLRLTDGLPLVGGLCAAAVTAPWWRVGDARTALATLLAGWDHSAHFSMTSMIRRHGLTVDRLADPGLEHWKFIEYPQGFHSATAALMEVLAGPDLGSPADETVLYVHAVAWLLVVVAVVAVAAVAALPWVRRHPAPGLAAAVAVVAVVTVVPGGEAFVTGFPNFVLAAVLAGCVPLLAVTMPRAAMPLQLAALTTLLVAVAQGWLLLLVAAGPAAMTIAFRRGAWRAPRRAWWWAAAIAVAALAGLVWVLRTISALDASEVLVIEGSIVTHSPAVMAAVAVLTPALLLLARRLHRSLGWLAIAPGAGVAATALLGLYQRVTAGGLSYYFWKLLVGLLIIDLLLIAAAAAVALPRLGSRRPGATSPARAPIWHAAVSATAVIGLLGALVATDYLPAGDRTFPVPAEAPVGTDMVLEAARTVGQHAPPDEAPDPWLLLLPPDSGIHPLNAQQWFLALTGRWTTEANDRAHALVPPPGDVANLVSIARQSLEASPDARVVAPPALAAQLRAQLGEAGEGRIVTWE